jgi:hypothetical protein
MVPQFITLLVVVAASAALCGYTASAIARRKKERSGRSFTVGLLCGFTAGVIVRRRWRDIGRLAVHTMLSATRPNRLDWQPQRSRRFPLALLPVRR